MKVDELKVLDLIIADIESAKRLPGFKKFEDLIKRLGFEMARLYRKVACDAGLAEKRNKTAHSPAGMTWTHEARELRRQKRIKPK